MSKSNREIPRWERHFFDPLQLTMVSPEVETGEQAEPEPLSPADIEWATEGPRGFTTNEDRLDPSAPWRYECPECGSVQVDRRPAWRDRKKSYTADGVGAAEAEEDRKKRYRCVRCNELLRSVIDRKTGELVQP